MQAGSQPKEKNRAAAASYFSLSPRGTKRPRSAGTQDTERGAQRGWETTLRMLRRHQQQSAGRKPSFPADPSLLRSSAAVVLSQRRAGWKEAVPAPPHGAARPPVRGKKSFSKPEPGTSVFPTELSAGVGAHPYQP